MSDKTRSKPKSATTAKPKTRTRTPARPPAGSKSAQRQKSAATPKRATKPAATARTKRTPQAKSRKADFEARVAEWDGRIKDVEAQYKRARANVSSEVEELMVGLRKSRDDAREQIDKLKTAGDTAWERSRSAVEDALSEVAAAYEAVRRRLT